MAFGIVGLVFLGGCGFHPLYLSGGKAPGEASVRAELANVAVAPIPDRVGQLVRNDLVFLMAPTADAQTAAYRLDVRLTERISELAVESTGFATRANLRLSAAFALVDLGTGKAVMSSRARAISSYNIVDASFSTLTAQNAARERAARRIAEDIRSRISAYFAGREAGSAPSLDPEPPPPVDPPRMPAPQPGRPL
jgi:LPS-assembly lipoprotein